MPFFFIFMRKIVFLVNLSFLANLPFSYFCLNYVLRLLRIFISFGCFFGVYCLYAPLLTLYCLVWCFNHFNGTVYPFMSLCAHIGFIPPCCLSLVLVYTASPLLLSSMLFVYPLCLVIHSLRLVVYLLCPLYYTSLMRLVYILLCCLLLYYLPLSAVMHSLCLCFPPVRCIFVSYVYAVSSSC